MSGLAGKTLPAPTSAGPSGERSAVKPSGCPWAAGVCSQTAWASRSSATAHRSASRWPQSTSRSSARRYSVSSSTSASTPVCAGRQPADHRALERDRVGGALGHRGAVLGPGADRGQPARRDGRCRGPRARAGPAAPAGSRSAPRTARAAHSPSRTGPAPRRPLRCAACGAPPGCRTPATRPPARPGSAGAARAGRSRRAPPSATRRRRSASTPPARARSRRARTAGARSASGESGPAPPTPAAAPRDPASRSGRSARCGSSPSPHTASDGASSSASPRTSESPSPSAISVVSRVERDPQQRRHHGGHRAPLVDRLLEFLVRGLEPVRVESELGALGEHDGQERPAARRRRIRGARTGSASLRAGGGTPRPHPGRSARAAPARRSAVAASSPSRSRMNVPVSGR